MAIYERFGATVTIVRVASLEDVKKLEQRKPDKQDHEAVANGSYVVVRCGDEERERLYHQAYLRADGGSREIGQAIDALSGRAAGDPTALPRALKIGEVA